MIGMKDEARAEAFSDGIPVWKKYALSIPEAAKYFGIGEKINKTGCIILKLFSNFADGKKNNNLWRLL